MFREVSISTFKELEQNAKKEIFGERILKLLEIHNTRTETNPSIEVLKDQVKKMSQTVRQIERKREGNWRTSPEGLVSEQLEVQRKLHTCEGEDTLHDVVQENFSEQNDIGFQIVYDPLRTMVKKGPKSKQNNVKFYNMEATRV